MKAMSNRVQFKVSALLVALTVVTVMAAVPFASAESVHPAVTLAKLAGPWQATVIGQGGCGFGSKLLNFTMNSSGGGAGTWSSNTVDCGSSTVSLSVTITSLNSDGSGQATLDAGSGVFHFNIQVNSNATVFNMVDITDASNYEEGTAIKQ